MRYIPRFNHLPLLIFFFIPGMWVVRDYYNIFISSPYYILMIFIAFPFLTLRRQLFISNKPLLTMLPILLYASYVMFVIITSHLLLIHDSVLYSDYFNYNFGALMACLLAFAVGLSLPKDFYIPVAISLFLYIPLIFVLFDYDSVTLNQEFLSSTSGSLYLNLADYFGLGALMLLPRLKGFWLPAFILLTSCCLFVLYSRATFFVFLFVVSLFYISTRPWRGLNLIITIVFLLLMLNFEDSGSRFFSLFNNPTEDPSAVERFDQYIVGLDIIFNNILWGDYYSIPTFFGHYGGYIHGVLSHYQVYGLFPFFLLLIVFFYLALIFLKTVFKKVKNTVDCLFLLIIPYCLLLSFFARGYTWSLDFFVFGVVICMSTGRSQTNRQLRPVYPLSR